MPRVLINGRTIAYEHAGEGRPLVLLHGIGSSARSRRHQLTGLSDAFSVIAWDAPGYGGSDDPPETVEDGRLRRVSERVLTGTGHLTRTPRRPFGGEYWRRNPTVVTWDGCGRWF